MLKGVGKQIQQCWATLWQLSWNKRNGWSCFKLCATPPKNTQQHATGVQMGATGHIQQCFKLLANNLVSVCTCWAVDMAMEVSSSLCNNSAT